MIEFLVGLSVGLYIGTYYNCKPVLDNIINFVKTKVPKKVKLEERN